MSAPNRGTPAAGLPLASFTGVSKWFEQSARRVLALDRVDLTVNHGEFLAIVGPSGCGKSTLLNILAGLSRPSAGEVRYKGEPVTRVNTDVGYVTQADNLMPWRNVRGNVAIALELQGVRNASRSEKVTELIKKVGLSGFEGAYPSELSGGMRKRVALIRTLIYRPATLLMDEPFGALDAQLKVLLQAELMRLWESFRSTIVFVTHDLSEAIALGDRVAVMSARPGRVKKVYEIDLPRPRDVARIRFSPRFGALHEELWSAIEEDLTERPTGASEGAK